MREVEVIDVNPSDILGYGLMGLGFLLALLAYRLLANQQRKEEPSAPILRATNTFMTFAAVLCAIGVVVELAKNSDESAGSSAGSEMEFEPPEGWQPLVSSADGFAFAFPRSHKFVPLGNRQLGVIELDSGVINVGATDFSTAESLADLSEEELFQRLFDEFESFIARLHTGSGSPQISETIIGGNRAIRAEYSSQPPGGSLLRQVLVVIWDLPRRNGVTLALAVPPEDFDDQVALFDEVVSTVAFLE